MTNKIKDTVISGKIWSGTLGDNNRLFFLEDDNNKLLVQNIDSMGNKCSAGYIYNGNNYDDSMIDKFNEKYLFSISLSCSTTARAEHFPVKKP